MSGAEELAPLARAKEDPETLALRGRPRRVVRFRRGLMITCAACLAAGIIALAWVALDPPALRHAAGLGEPAELPGRPPDQALARLPAGYGDAPRLGPPLPGDLGRPILEQQRSMADPGAVADDTGLLAAEAARAAAVSRERAAAALQAARSSAVMVVPTGGGGLPARTEAAGQAAKNAGEGSGNRDAAPAALRLAPSPWTLVAGTVIPASLMTGLNSDLPGMVIAQVTEDVRDSATGRTVLVPQGARLIGRYDSKIAYGQRRAFLAWTRLVLPDGASIALDDMPATDAAGRSGLADRVDGHGWRLLKGVALSTLLGVGTELSLGGGGPLARALRESAQQGGARAGDQVVGRGLDVQPTITVRPGWPVRVLVSRDLVLQPWRG